MSISVADALFLASGLMVFGGALVVFGTGFYLGYTKGDIFLELFPNSSSIITIPGHIDSGLLGKIRLVYSVSSVVTFPRIFLKHGVIAAEDLERFPSDLRRRLVALQWTLLTVLSGMMILGLGVMAGVIP